MNNIRPCEFVEHASPLPFDATLECLVTAIAERGMTLFARVDHAANARDVGMSMPPATVLIYGHAKGGTPIMIGTPVAALDLPLRVLVREREDGTTAIVFHPVVAMLGSVGVPTEVAARLEPAQQMLLDALAQ